MHVCVRRCEELPWQSRRVLQWYELKNVLTNLSSFKQMVSCHLKTEFMDLWLLLSRGPMPVSHGDNNGNSNKNGSIDVGDTDDSNMAQEQSVHRLEQVVLSGYSHQTIRRQELTGFVAPFDIVQEMNASVERWKTSTHSNDDEIKSMLLLISDFLCEFSQRLGPGPLFLRPSIDLKYFTLLGVTTRDHVRNEPKQQSDYQIIDDDNAIEPTNNVVTLTASRSRANSSKLNNKGQGTNNLDESAGVNNQLHDTISEISGSFPSQNQIESHLLSYLRWIWIQLPWLALNKARCIGRKVLLDKQNALARSTDLRLNSSQVIAADESSLALRPFRVKSSDASIYEDQDDNFQVDEVQFPEPVGIIVSQKLLRRLAVSGILPDGFSTQKHTTVDKVSSQSGPTLASSACNSILDLNDVRAVSKSTSHSEIDLIGMNYASLITLETSQLAFATSNKRPVSRLIEYAGHGILACDMTKTNRFKYRRNIDEDEEANKGLLYAEHSEFHKNRHSLFPNVEDAVRDQFADSEGKDKYLYNTSAQILQLGGTTKCDDLNLYRRLNGLAEDDLMEEYNLINQSSLPMTKDEVLTSKHTAKFTRERLGQDNSAYQMKCKLQTLQQVQSRLKQKMNEYQRAQEASTMTMDCLQELQSKYQEVHKVVNDETLIKYGYLEILEVFEKNPANSQYHIAEIEQHVKLGEQQLHDLIRFRKKALEAKDHASRFKSYQLDTKIEYYLEARELLQSKRKKFLQKCDLSEEDVTEALMSIRSNARISSCDSSDCHHQYGKSDKDDDISKKYDTANLNQSGLIDWDNGSFRLIKDSFSKPTPSTKHNESHEIVPANINNKQLETSDAQTSHSSNASSGVFQTIKDRYEGHELFSSDQFIQEAILTLDGKAIKRLSDETSKESQRIVRKLKTEYLLQSTCSRDEDDFIQRINANETLNASLQNTLQSTDEMCGNIRREVDYLYRELNSLGTVCTKDEESAKESENDLDGLIPSTNSKRDFESSVIDSIKDDQVGDHSLTMQCNDAADQTNVSNANREESLTQKSRQLELVSNQLTRNQKKVMDARTGISHIVNGLHINSSLLCSLPRSTSPPTLATDADISTGLVWIEEKLVAINEAMVIDESSSANMQGKGYIQTIGAEEATVAQRQQKLAVQVQRMLKLDNPMVITARNNPMKETHTLSKDTMHDDVKKLAKVGSITEPLKQYSKMSNTLQPVSNNTQKIGDTITEQNKHFITNKNHILMRPPQERDNVFSDEMKKLHLRQDKEGQEEEALRREREALLNRPRNVHKFIDDALATPESRKLLRQAKRLSRHVKSPKAFSKYGITLDALLGNRASIKVPSSVPVVTNPTIGPASDMEDDSEELMSLKQVSRVDIDD